VVVAEIVVAVAAVEADTLEVVDTEAAAVEVAG
jgi:hypothetical protein